MTQFDIDVTRYGVSQRIITVEAETMEEAEQLALDEAGNHEFSEHSSEYTVTDGANSDEACDARQQLVDKVLEEIKSDAERGDYTALEEMFLQLLQGIPWNESIIKNYLPEEG